MCVDPCPCDIERLVTAGGLGHSRPMTRTRTVLQAVGLAGCLSTLGVAALTFGASCIIPDKGIVVHERGYSWCTRANDARAWTHPDDSTRLEFTKSGIFFRTVDRGDVGYIAGIRSGDELISIEGNAINDIGDIADALGDLANSTSATAKLKDSNGANVTIQLSVL